MKSGCPPYSFWTEQARRWDKCVDYGSPMSAWTAEMHETLSECGGDRLKATEALRQRRAYFRQLDRAMTICPPEFRIFHRQVQRYCDRLDDMLAPS
mgnify:CR=1 FL=1